MENRELHKVVAKETEEVGKKRKRNLNSESKSVIRVELNDSLSKSLSEAISVLAERGINKKFSDFVEFYLTNVGEDEIQLWIEKETPMEWRLKAALADPLKEQLIKKIFGLSSIGDSATLIRIEKALADEEAPKKERKKRVPRIAETSKEHLDANKNFAN